MCSSAGSTTKLEQFNTLKYADLVAGCRLNDAPGTATAKCSATTNRALPTELALADLTALQDANKTLRINTTSVYINRDGFWMQPEVDNELCTDCGSEHEMMRPCAMHGGYQSITPLC